MTAPGTPETAAAVKPNVRRILVAQALADELSAADAQLGLLKRMLQSVATGFQSTLSTVLAAHNIEAKARLTEIDQTPGGPVLVLELPPEAPPEPPADPAKQQAQPLS